MSEVERLLRSALVPVEPPVNLIDDFEEALQELAQAAADELVDWELGAMRDPRNWARPAAAVLIGGAAGGTLVLVRARQQQRKRQPRALRALEAGVRDVVGGVRKRLAR